MPRHESSHAPTTSPLTTEGRRRRHIAETLCGLLEQASRSATELEMHPLAAQLEASAGRVYAARLRATASAIGAPSMKPSASTPVDRGRARVAPAEPTRLEEWRGHDDQAEQLPRDFKLERAPSEFMPAESSSGDPDLDRVRDATEGRR